MNPNLVIAIDGPAGAGKSTVSRILADRLGISYLDTGAMYRALAWAAREKEIEADDAAGLGGLLHQIDISFGTGQTILVDGKDVTSEIRTAEIGEMASSVSIHAAVRQGMVRLQQEMVAKGGVVLEGRDATTAIAPQATVKVYLTASLEERAQRRNREFAEKGIETSFESVRNQIEARDHRDITRDESPLTVAPGASVIESAGKSPEQVAELIIELIPTD